MSKAILIPFKSYAAYEGQVYIEFKDFKSANSMCESTLMALYWLSRVAHHYSLSRTPKWRLWTEKPTREQSEGVEWEE